ncbi:MAG: cysteine desulfurase family protein [Anaerolineaceae bacterium]|nr:cysteine desulfurase family protein [Anaerolineaceae bacterium]
MDRIYLDYAATTPMDPRVLDAMSPFFIEDFGNPSSTHYFGQKTEAAVDLARQEVARILGAKQDEIYFNSGGSEGDNLAIRGAAIARKRQVGADTILISPVEHHAISWTARQLAEESEFNVVKLRVDKFGIIDLDNLEDSLKKYKVAVVSTVYANNEIGTLNPIIEIGELCHRYGVPFHSDTVQACAHLNVNARRENIGMLSVSGHKLYGPKGVGLFFKEAGLTLSPQMTGGKQENKLRAGTHNVPGIIGLAKAMSLAAGERENENKRLIFLRDKLIRFVTGEIPGAFLTGHPTDRLPNHASFVFENLSGNDLVIALDMAGFACSSGSACKVGDPKPSDILLGIGLTPEMAKGSLRITLGKYSTEEHIDKLIAILPVLVNKLRK